MQRRHFLRIVIGGTAALGLTGCAGEPEIGSPSGGDAGRAGPDAAHAGGQDAGQASPGDAAAGCDAGVVFMHDTNAQALYLDGTLGPLTGVIYVDYVIDGVELTLDFWHGHNGIQHRWTLEPHHFAALKRGERITLTTTTVEDHAHTLFVDPVDESYRVPGAPDVLVTVGCMGTG